MGIREDIDSGICREEYVLVTTAVAVVANHADLRQEDVARWLIRKDATGFLRTHCRDHKLGQMIQIHRDPFPRNDDNAQKVLHLIERGGVFSDGTRKLLRQLAKALRQQAEDLARIR